MTAVSVCPATDLDADLGAARAIAQLAEQHDGAPPVSDQAFLAVAQGDRTLWIAERNGRTIGFGIGGQGELDAVVAPEDRGQGAGSAIISTVLSALRRHTRGTAGDRTHEDTSGEPSGEQSSEQKSSDPSNERSSDPSGEQSNEQSSDASGRPTSDPSEREEVRAWVHGSQPAAVALLNAAGFRPVRSLFRMALDPTLLPPSDVSAPSLPDGYAIHTFGEHGTPEADANAWVATNAAAFVDHPEQGRVTRTEFDQLTQEPWFDAADLMLLTRSRDAHGSAHGNAHAHGSSHAPGSTHASENSGTSDSTPIVAFAWVKTLRQVQVNGTPNAQQNAQQDAQQDVQQDAQQDAQQGAQHDDARTSGTEADPVASTAPDTELYVLGVAPQAAGAGLGRLMLDFTLWRMAQHEPRSVTLYVDGENSRAVELYEKNGFTVAARSQQWAR